MLPTIKALVVVGDFAGHSRGDLITDPAQVAAIPKSPWASYVRLINHPALPTASEETH